MFRLLENHLPKDFEFPADLQALGYVINEKDQIRMATDPEQEFHFFISKNERACEMSREAMDTCIRRIVMSRLQAQSLEVTRLPLGTSVATNHVPVLTSKNLSTAKRIIIYIGETCQDLGIFAYRVVGRETINSGSAVDFVAAAQSAPDNPAIIIANTGQLLFHRKSKTAISQRTWLALPRRSAVHPPFQLTEKNLIPGNENPKEHAKSVFEEVVMKMADEEAKIFVVGHGDGATEMVDYLQDSWDLWQGRVEAICVGSSYIWSTPFVDLRFQEYWGRRARAYLTSEQSIDTPLWGRSDFGCNCFSSGEISFQESLIPRCHRSILKYFEMVAENPDYEEIKQDLPVPGSGDGKDGEGADVTEEEHVQAVLAAMKLEGGVGENISVEVKHNPEA
ncbi:MAG: hypothetical protein MMC33_006085 [Icmadophila ericetorum]|nr:hypothetical protein [Icmadophila ericetorum]